MVDYAKQLMKQVPHQLLSYLAPVLGPAFSIYFGEIPTLL